MKDRGLKWRGVLIALPIITMTEDGASPVRAVVVDTDGNLYGTTRIGGQNLCGPGLNSCGAAWVMDRRGEHSTVLHQFTPNEGHGASLLQAGRIVLWLRGVADYVSVTVRDLIPDGTVGTIRGAL